MDWNKPKVIVHNWLNYFWIKKDGEYVWTKSFNYTDSNLKEIK